MWFWTLASSNDFECFSYRGFHPDGVVCLFAEVVVA